jgi:putative ABC transport system ATP-binding protein
VPDATLHTAPAGYTAARGSAVEGASAGERNAAERNAGERIAAPLTAPILEARDLTRRFRLGGSVVDAVRGVSLSVRAGEFVALMGPSGSGKSTLLQLLGGLDRPTSGDVVLDGAIVSQLSDEEATRLRREKTGFVFQFFNLIPLLDVTENVALPFTIAGSDRRDGDMRQRIADVIELVDLSPKARHRPDQLSAGEQQRVAVARALVTRPALLFADEPTGNLDYTTGTEILDALWRSCVERGQTIVLVTHDSKAAAYADRVLVIEDGRVLDEIVLGRRDTHDATPLIARLAQLGL